jgi:hypothetical protein
MQLPMAGQDDRVLPVMNASPLEGEGGNRFGLTGGGYWFRLLAIDGSANSLREPPTRRFASTSPSRGEALRSFSR